MRGWRRRFLHNAVFFDSFSARKRKESSSEWEEGAKHDSSTSESSALPPLTPYALWHVMFSPPSFLPSFPFTPFLSLLPPAIPFPPLVNPPQKKKKIGQGNLPAPPPATSPPRFVWYLTTATVAFTNFICAEFMSDSYSVRTGERSKGGCLRVRCVYTGIMWTIHNTSTDTSVAILSIMLLLFKPGATIKA